jgi:hypothetical protein
MSIVKEYKSKRYQKFHCNADLFPCMVNPVPTCVNKAGLAKYFTSRKTYLKHMEDVHFIQVFRGRHRCTVDGDYREDGSFLCEDYGDVRTYEDGYINQQFIRLMNLDGTPVPVSVVLESKV